MAVMALLVGGIRRPRVFYERANAAAKFRARKKISEIGSRQSGQTTLTHG
jgi:hypothetical protein